MALFSRIVGFCYAVEALPYLKPYGGSALSDILVLAGALPSRGVPWRASSGAERAALKRLSKAGLLDLAGDTLARRVRLTTRGVCAFYAGMSGVKRSGMVDLIKRVLALPAVPGGNGRTHTVMGFHLLPSAGEWWALARKSVDAGRAYQRDLWQLHTTLLYCVLAGWVSQSICSTQTQWSARITEDGMHAEMPTDLPAVEVDLGAWEHGFDGAITAFWPTPPDAGNELALPIPATKWF